MEPLQLPVLCLIIDELRLELFVSLKQANYREKHFLVFFKKIDQDLSCFQTIPLLIISFATYLLSFLSCKN